MSNQNDLTVHKFWHFRENDYGKISLKYMAFFKFSSSLLQVWLQTFCGWSNATAADQLVVKVRRQGITINSLKIFPKMNSLIARLFSQKNLPSFHTVSHRCRRLEVDREIWLDSLYCYHGIFSQLFKMWMSGHEDAHLVGCVQEHTLCEGFIGRTAYLPVLYWWLQFPHLDHIWVSNEGITRAKELQREIKSWAGKNTYSYLLLLTWQKTCAKQNCMRWKESKQKKNTSGHSREIVVRNVSIP